mmetsp:Transcript_13095/g.44030  ORF Transcript_13095/g.44030 Transcript_13095/m.44030 type:complete len:206 (-) Transcript_13095:117-734(-)
MRLFRDAESVVGYHGAGFVNTAFSRYACVHELSTFNTLSTSLSDLWRTNKKPLLRVVPSLSWHLHLLPLKQLLLANNLSTVLPPPPVPMGRCRSLPLRLRGCRSPKPHEPTQNAEMPPPTWRETPFRRACFDTGLSSGAAARAASRQEGARRVATCLRARHARQPPVRGQLRANEAQVGHDDRGAGGNACGPGGRVCGRAPNRHH